MPDRAGPTWTTAPAGTGTAVAKERARPLTRSVHSAPVTATVIAAVVRTVTPPSVVVRDGGVMIVADQPVGEPGGRAPSSQPARGTPSAPSPPAPVLDGGQRPRVLDDQRAPAHVATNRTRVPGDRVAGSRRGPGPWPHLGAAEQRHPRRRSRVDAGPEVRHRHRAGQDPGPQVVPARHPQPVGQTRAVGETGGETAERHLVLQPRVRADHLGGASCPRAGPPRRGPRRRSGSAPRPAAPSRARRRAPGRQLALGRSRVGDPVEEQHRPGCRHDLAPCRHAVLTGGAVEHASAAWWSSTSTSSASAP